MNKKQIKDLALSNGFKLKEQPSGEMDLNPYVYDFADALLAKANERVEELESELLMLTLATGRESTWQLGKQLLNKFAIEKKLKAVDDLLEEIQCSVVVPKRYKNFQKPYLDGIRHCIQFIKCQSEQLRKEQD